MLDFSWWPFSFSDEQVVPYQIIMLKNKNEKEPLFSLRGADRLTRESMSHAGICSGQKVKGHEHLHGVLTASPHGHFSLLAEEF